MSWGSLSSSFRMRCIPRAFLKKPCGRFASTDAIPLSNAPGVRSFPGAGSLLSFPQPDEVFEYRKSIVKGGLDFQACYLDMYNQHGGKLWTVGLPGIGKNDSHGTCLIVSDPQEYMKVIRSETSPERPYPSGAVEMIWPVKNYYNHKGGKQIQGKKEASRILGRDSDWQNLRHFLQKDLQTAKDARSYIPAITRAAELASKGAPANCGDFMNFLHRCSFDMFAATMFGSQSETADMSTPSLDVDRIYSQAAERVISNEGAMMMLPMELMANAFGMQSKLAKELEESADLTFEIANEKVAAFSARWKSGELDEIERTSYMARCLERQENNEVVTQSMLVGAMWALLTASVDTTSTLTSWVLVQLACHPEAQEKLAEELQAELGAGGRLTAEVAAGGRGKWLPYLHNIIRESHRMRPAMFPTLLKETAVDLEIEGYDIPKGNCVFGDTFALQNDPSLVEDPGQFRPERWSPSAVKARRGTAAEVIDHPLLRTAFSAGARKCPGSTVSNFEMMSLVIQLVQDYKFSFEDETIRSVYDVPYKQTTTNFPSPFPPLSFQPRN